MNLYRYQYQMARTLIQEHSSEGTPEPSVSLAAGPQPKGQIYTWLARALALAVLMGMVGLWVYGLIKRFAF